MIENAFTFFYETLEQEKKERHQISIDQHLYLSTFLEKHLESHLFFTSSEDSKLEKPTLAFLLKEALEEMDSTSRLFRFKRLGDAALYTLGVFPLSLQRSLVGADYYVNMGTNAYQQAYDLGQEEVFQKLSKNFKNLTDLLNVSMALKIKPLTPLEILSMWSITGSEGLRLRLVQEGLNPQKTNTLLS